MYTHDTQGCAAPEGEHVYIRQSMAACVNIRIPLEAPLKNAQTSRETDQLYVCCWLWVLIVSFSYNARVMILVRIMSKIINTSIISKIQTLSFRFSCGVS